MMDYFFGNATVIDDDFASNLRPAGDVSVDTVVTSLYLNLIVFAALMASYEFLRRMLPSVYAARRQRSRFLQREQASSDPDDLNDIRAGLMREPSLSGIPDDSPLPLNWISPVFGVPWAKVRRIAGMDGYFFLRYIRMCLRITAVSSFWAGVILMPVYATGANGANGFYHLSMTNIESGTWRMWVPVVFIYLFTGFCFFVMKQEYRHFIELRMDFLGKGDKNVIPQQRYSLMVENIPRELRSDRALFDYFDKLFPGKMHSASVVLNLPDLETLAARRLRVLHRLEKSIATFHATGERPTHVMGRHRANCCGIHVAPLDCVCSDPLGIDVPLEGPMPQKGSRVDSISYYTRELADLNKEVYLLQQKKTQVAESGNVTVQASNWLTNMAVFAHDAALVILEESVKDNALTSPRESPRHSLNSIPQAEMMTSQYGAVGWQPSGSTMTEDRLVADPMEKPNRSVSWAVDEKEGDDKAYRLVTDDYLVNREGRAFTAPGGRKKERTWWSRIAGRLGLDFAASVFRQCNRQMDVVVESVVGSTMASTGFVTFLDLATVTSAASTPLTNRPNVLDVMMAPEPRDIRWRSAHVSSRLIQRRENFANLLLFFGVIFWFIPLAAIQAFATAEQLARIPGMDWILTFQGGSLSSFINGYLPVLALLGLIVILPFIFQYIATEYEQRKTFSDVQRSILGRYFYYQLANIYITVTAGSLWRSLADIIDRPSSALEVLGESLPFVVGYFISLLITKIFAGLPIVVLRVGALSRMVFLKTFFLDESLSQRELDAVYRPENVMYGWEYPTQLLVIVICFTYACICPVILPVGALFFGIALMVYKKQLMYVYTPVYESGGALFPSACDRTLFGLICGQCTLLGYTIIRGAYYKPMVLTPLPIATIWGMNYFRQHYVHPSGQLSMERAMECDRVSNLRAAQAAGASSPDLHGIQERQDEFDKNQYRQPVLALHAMEPLPYRRGVPDQQTEDISTKLRSINRFVFMPEQVASQEGGEST